MWFDLERRDLGFIDSAPFKIENAAVFDAPPERVFSCIVGEGQTEWFKDFKGVTWLTPEPHAVGSTRNVHLKLLSVKERVLAFEPGKRFTFAVDRITLPLLRAMAEDLRITPHGDGKSRLVWNVHYVPSLAMRLVHPIGRSIFGGMFEESMAGLGRYLKKNA